MSSFPTEVTKRRVLSGWMMAIGEEKRESGQR